MDIGPFHFTNEISVGALLTILTIIYTGARYLGKMVIDYQVRNERLDKLWKKFNGESEDDPDSWFYRLEKMETRVNEIWNRLKFNRISLDATKTRQSDGSS